MVFLCQFGHNPPIGSGDKSADKAHLYSVVTLKIWSRSPKSNQIFKPSQSYNMEFGQNPSFGSRDRVQTRFFFGQNLKISKGWCNLENEVKVTKI